MPDASSPSPDPVDPSTQSDDQSVVPVYPPQSGMPCFLFLLKLTADGALQTDDIYGQVAEFETAATKLGGHVESVHLLLGHYDLSCMVSLPDDESALSLALTMAKQGHFTPTTMRAIPVAEVTQAFVVNHPH